MTYELSMQELHLQGAELLPAREALSKVDVDATNVAVAFNIDSEDAEATAVAVQEIDVEN